ncbi:hypothetical protein FXV83_07660 [Bradyrhizobium hipponense]|uniref:PH domain-containing protein n=1 Tax=Bradyrhizobium hipponense TaxID=2605638 RepID=A0A5S4YSQ6_9BRAD|nr:hypothetical protein [Bradyrhizobium hipponense]TYO67073.1 hypothetical protein FXV83_07660 [Bradyrhizobium hipponense]
MVDAPREEMSDWLAALRDPIGGDLKLSSFVRAPEHIPNVLSAVGEQQPSDRRRIVVALDRWATNLWFASEFKPSLSFTETRQRLERIVAAGKILRTNMHAELRFAISWANVLKAPIAARDDVIDAMHIPDATFDVGLMFLIEGADELLSNPEAYRAVFWQPPGTERHKSLVRALLWEPLLDLLDEFKLESYDQHQPLIHSIRSLHLACGIEAPNESAVRVAVHERKKAALSQPANSPPT